MKIKAILDTNVFISGVFWKGPPFEILKAWQEQRFRLAISPPILDEYRRVLDELTKERALPVLSSILKVIEFNSELVEPISFSEPVCSDPHDDKFLEAAVAASANYVVSGDRALLNIKSHHRVEIVRPARFFEAASPIGGVEMRGNITDKILPTQKSSFHRAFEVPRDLQRNRSPQPILLILR